MYVIWMRLYPDLETQILSNIHFKPESAVNVEESSRSEGVIAEDAPRSEGDVVTSSTDIVPPPRRSSSRPIGSSSNVPVKAAVMQHKRLLHTLHRDLPVRITKKKKDGSLIIVSKANAIQKIQQYLTPASMKQALAGPDAVTWRAARDAEHKSLETNKTFQYVSRDDVPDGIKIIKSLYVLKTVLHADGSLKKYKVRLVARGDPSTYNETYASCYVIVICSQPETLGNFNG